MSKVEKIKVIANRILNLNKSGNKRIVFVHIAKCGGVSIDRALKRNFLFRSKRLTSFESLQAAKIVSGLSNVLDDDYHTVLEYRDKLLRYFLEDNNTQYLSGHFCFSKKLYKEYRDKYSFVTMLRNPVERFLSSYFYNYSKLDDSPWKIKCSLRDYVQTEQGKNLGHDYVKFIGGLREDRNYCSSEAIEQAVDCLKLFSVTGILENPVEFEKKIEKKIGYRVKLKKSNRSPVPKKERISQINEMIEGKIKKICEPDLRIYNEALKCQ